MEELKKCPRCGEEFSQRAIGKITEKKYCSIVCRRRANAKYYYDLKKDTQEYKDKRKEYFKTWVAKNRKKFNLLCNENTKKYLKKKRKSAHKNNLCYRCFKPLSDKRFRSCESCRDKINKKYRLAKLKQNE